MDVAICKRFEVDEAVGDADIAVVVDALRASATAAELLAVGAEYVRPVREASAADARDDVVLVGEENGERIEGFDFTNSPTAIRDAASRIEGNGAVLRTTNGTECVSDVGAAAEVFMGSLVNRGALTRSLVERASGCDAGRIWFVPARRRGEYAREDMYSCLRLRESVADALGRDVYRASRYLGDSAEEVFVRCDTGEYLASLGHEDDVAFCATADGNAAVPRLVGDRFVNAGE